MRNVLLAFGLIAVLMAGGILIGVRSQPSSVPGWQEFSIGPAQGLNTSISPYAIHSDGMTLNLLLAVAYTIPRTQIVGPEWLKAERFAITAMVPADGNESMAALLRQELRRRIGLTAHEEERDFEAYVLTAGMGTRRLVPVPGRDNNNSVHPQGFEVKEATLSDLCGVLQSVLGKPVVNETGIEGRYEFVMAWGENTERTMTEALSAKFGLTLTRANRRLPAVVVDHAERGAGVAILSGVGRIASGWPVVLRRGVSRALTVH